MCDLLNRFGRIPNRICLSLLKRLLSVRQCLLTCWRPKCYVCPSLRKSLVFNRRSDLLSQKFESSLLVTSLLVLWLVLSSRVEQYLLLDCCYFCFRWNLKTESAIKRFHRRQMIMIPESSTASSKKSTSTWDCELLVLPLPYKLAIKPNCHRLLLWHASQTVKSRRKTKRQTNWIEWYWGFMVGRSEEQSQATFWQQFDVRMVLSMFYYGHKNI